MRVSSNRMWKRLGGREIGADPPTTRCLPSSPPSTSQTALRDPYVLYLSWELLERDESSTEAETSQVFVSSPSDSCLNVLAH